MQKFGFATSGEPLDAAGNANRKISLKNCRITNAVRCLPPQNKSEPVEVKTCNGYVAEELAMLPKGAVVMVLGTITHNAVLMALQLRKGDFAFKRGAQHLLPNGATLFDSYHCSRYNTQTKRFTTQMFEDVVASVAEHLKSK